MNKKALGFFVSLLAVAVLALPMSAAYATKPITVNGTFFPVGAGSTDLRQAGKSDNYVLTISDSPMQWTGDIAGVGTFDGRWVLHNYGDPVSLTINSNGVWTLVAEVDGKEGTLTIKGAQGHWRIISGTGELANLHGEGTTETIYFGLWSYTGQVHFDP